MTVPKKEFDEFVYAVSHDLREPMKKITAFGKHLQETADGELGEKSKEYLKIILSASDRMVGMIDDLLEFSRTGRLQTESIATEVPLDLLIKEILTDLMVDPQDVYVTMRNLPVVWGHSPRLRRVFQNLLTNSLKFRREGIHLEIGISSKKVGGILVITYEDNGIGFDPVYNEKIFGLFERLHTRFEYPGTGVGLSLCRRLLTSYGATIDAQGTPDLGSKFTLRLPKEMEIAHHAKAPETISAVR